MAKSAAFRASTDPRAWYEAHRAVLAFLRSKAVDISEDDRDDLASEVMEALLVKQGGETIENLCAFAVTIAKGKLLNARRKRGRQATAPSDELDQIESPLTSGEDAARPDRRRARALLDRQVVQCRLAAERGYLMMHEIGLCIAFLDGDTAAQTDEMIKRLDATWHAWAGGTRSEVRLEILSALEFATMNERVDRQDPHDAGAVDAKVRRSYPDAGNDDPDVDSAVPLAEPSPSAEPSPDAEPSPSAEPSPDSDDSEVEPTGVDLVRQYLETIGKWDLVRALPEAAIQVAVNAWRRRAGERGPLRKFEGASLLLKWAGDEESGASPEALRKSWQRLLKANQGRGFVWDDGEVNDDAESGISK